MKKAKSSKKEREANALAYTLVKFRDNWADEFELDGFWAGPECDWLGYISSLPPDLADVEIYFGTNEAFSYNDLEDYLGKFKTKTISKDEFLALRKLFGDPSLDAVEYGIFPRIEPDEDEYLEDEDDEDADLFSENLEPE